MGSVRASSTLVENGVRSVRPRVEWARLTTRWHIVVGAEARAALVEWEFTLPHRSTAALDKQAKTQNSALPGIRGSTHRHVSIGRDQVPEGAEYMDGEHERDKEQHDAAHRRRALRIPASEGLERWG